MDSQTLSKEECISYLIKQLTTWHPQLEKEYYEGTSIPDCTCMCIAAAYGKLDFLKWAFDRHPKEFGFNTVNYATNKYQLPNEDDQKELVSWLLQNVPIYDWKDAPSDTMKGIQEKCNKLGLDQLLLLSMNRLN